jgi:colanic acid biosynthesis glycosyl transferase WcaI
VRRLRVLLLSTTYWPDPAGIGLYATEIAEHLAAGGHRVEAVTALPHYPQWQIAPAYRGCSRQTERRNGVDLTRLWLYVPREQSAARRAAYEVSFIGHALVRVRPPRPLDLVLALMPNVGNAALGLWYATRTGARLVVFMQDLSGRGAEESGVSGGDRVAALVSRAENALAARADVVTVCSESFRAHLEAGGVAAERIVPFPNWSRLPESTVMREAVRRRMGWDEQDRVVLHAGNMGLKQGLHLVADYAARAEVLAPGLRFVLVGDGNQRSRIERLTADAGNVTIVPPVPEEELPGLLAAADVLLLHERPGLREMSVPSKVTAYLAAGRPVVAAVEADGPAGREIARSGGGVVVRAGEPERLVRILDDVGSNHQRARELGATGRAYAQREYSREAAMRRLDAVIERALTLPRGRRFRRG